MIRSLAFGASDPGEREWGINASLRGRGSSRYELEPGPRTTKLWPVVGLMSGTSYDAVDAAAAEIRLVDDVLELTPRGMLSTPYPQGLRDKLAAALPPNTTTAARICELDTELGRLFASAAAEAIERLCGGAADLVVSHGQTMFHWVEGSEVRGSLQLGQPAWIAERTGLPVVSDLRARDIAAGGQGAPLVGLFDVLLLHGRPGRPAALNLGGIANSTVVSPGAAPLAFDIGPGNALIDAAAQHGTDGNQYCDRDGAMAGAGQVLPVLLDRLLGEPYYSKPWPKTTGKELFNLPYLLAALEGLVVDSWNDVVTTVTFVTARTIADAMHRLGATEVIASGGGVRNPVLMRMLEQQLAETPLRTSDELGIPAQAKEAYAFAALGFLSAHGMPGTVPSCTGASAARLLGTTTPGAAPLRSESYPVLPQRLRLRGARAQ